jgi:fibronectin-binding autotransporter adhesin
VSGTTCYRGGSATIGSGGSLLVSNTLVTFISPLTNSSASVILAGPSTITAGSNLVWISGSAATTTVGLVTFNSATTNVLSSGSVDFCQLAGATQALNGVVAGSGGLVKSGAGVLILAGSNTYSGVTLVSNGILQVNGSIHSSVTASGTGTLAGTGTVYGADHRDHHEQQWRCRMHHRERHPGCVRCGAQRA